MVARICRHSFVARRKHYVPAGDPRYMRLQAAFNAACWWSVFVALAVVLVQPLLASLIGGPSGWAALLGGLLTALGVLVEPVRRLGIWLEMLDPVRDISASRARMHGEIVRARTAPRVLLAVVPFFVGVPVLIVMQGQDANAHGTAAYASGFLLGLIHVYAAMNAVFSWRALNTLQSELRHIPVDASTSQPEPVAIPIPTAVLLTPALLADDGSEEIVDTVEIVDCVANVLDII